MLGATVALDTKVGYAHAIHAWFGTAQGQQQQRLADCVDFCAPGDVSMERSCQVAYLWWKLNRSHLIRVRQLCLDSMLMIYRCVVNLLCFLDGLV